MDTIMPLYDKSTTCLFCEENYKTKKVRSRFVKAIRHDSDFCSYYDSADCNPLLYYVSVCPECGFASSEEFSSFFPPLTKEKILWNIQKQWKRQSYSEKRSLQEVVNSYKLAIFSATLKSEKNIVLAGLYLRLAWIYRTYKIREQEIRFTKLALNEYIQSYLNDDYRDSQMSEIRILYLIGDLSIRLDKKEQAIQYFSKGVSLKDSTIEKGILEKMRDRWYELRKNPV